MNWNFELGQQKMWIEKGKNFVPGYKNPFNGMVGYSVVSIKQVGFFFPFQASYLTIWKEAKIVRAVLLSCSVCAAAASLNYIAEILE